MLHPGFREEMQTQPGQTWRLQSREVKRQDWRVLPFFYAPLYPSVPTSLRKPVMRSRRLPEPLATERAEASTLSAADPVSTAAWVTPPMVCDT